MLVILRADQLWRVPSQLEKREVSGAESGVQCPSAHLRV